MSSAMNHVVRTHLAGQKNQLVGRVQSLNAVNAAKDVVNKTSQEQQKQSQNNYVTTATQSLRDPTKSSLNASALSAGDIEVILANIGVRRPRLSRPKIESMLQSQIRSHRSGGSGNHDLSAGEMIDLISRIRSM
mmetsp:Transcript_19610/g.41113  ORF Transcript_19610/g.41113 Transcript_19610/m.41113 type:complete len:134 (+) Transcript_19610:218-619(+)